MKQLAPKHPLLTRWTHWVNFPILAIMVWSGLLIYWAHPAYQISVGGLKIFHFFPDWFYSIFRLDHRLAEGMAIHFVAGWFFLINGILYFIFAMVSGQWRTMVPDRHSLAEAWRVTLHDLGLIHSAPPVVKYNGAQKIAYTSIILMGAGSVISGLAIYRPIQLAWVVRLLGGYQMARLEHFALTIGFSLFFLIHIMQVIRAGYSNFRSMVAGWEVLESKSEAPNV